VKEQISKTPGKKKRHESRIEWAPTADYEKPARYTKALGGQQNNIPAQEEHLWGKPFSQEAGGGRKNWTLGPNDGKGNEYAKGRREAGHPRRALRADSEQEGKAPRRFVRKWKFSEKSKGVYDVHRGRG